MTASTSLLALFRNDDLSPAGTARLAAWLRREAGVNTLLSDTAIARAGTFVAREAPEWRRAILAEAEESLRLRVHLFGRQHDLAAIARRHGVAGRCGLVPWFHELATGVGFYPDPLTGRLVQSSDGRGFDKKYMNDLARLQWCTPLGEAYAVTGDERYSRAAVRILDDFFTYVPPRQGAPWAQVLNVGIRAANLVVLWQFLRRSPSLSDAFVVRVWKSIAAHVQACLADAEDWPIEPPHPMAELPHIRAVRRHGGVFRLLANHYLGGRIGVWAALNALPRGPATAGLRAAIAADLERELLHETLPEGMDFEASTHYHRFVTEMFFCWAMTSRNAGVAMSAAAHARFRRMFEFARDLTKPDGTMPQIGDMDNGRVHLFGRGEWRDVRYLTQLGACYFRDRSLLAPGIAPDRYAYWHFGPDSRRFNDATGRRRLASVCYRRTGVAVLRADNAYVAFAALANGQDGAGGHSHADKLGLEYVAGGRDILVDPGQGCYMSDFALRTQFRSARSHSVLTVDGQEINPICPGYQWFVPDEARARITAFARTGNRVAGEHRGFTHLHGRERYCRAVRLDADGTLTVEDRLPGRGHHHLEWRFVLAPGLTARPSRGRPEVALRDATGVRARLAFPDTLGIRVKLERTVFAWEYGRWSPVTVVVLACEAVLPAEACFVLTLCHSSPSSGR